MPQKNEIKLIALDLDGTLLNSQKELTARNAAALTRAAAAGIEIVPCTGRFFGGMPEAVRELPFLHYAITVNGAQVYDIRRDRAIARTEIPLKLVLRIMEYLDTVPVAYDCFRENWGWMSRKFWDNIERYTTDPHYHSMVRSLRTPVPELKAWLREECENSPATAHGAVQKIQLFTTDFALRDRLLLELPGQFPETAVTSSFNNNIEINLASAHKGAVLLQLADYLKIGREQTAAFGDGSNDVTLLRLAGLGVAMANACPAALAAADVVTTSCDEDGVARVLEKLLPS